MSKGRDRRRKAKARKDFLTMGNAAEKAANLMLRRFCKLVIANIDPSACEAVREKSPGACDGCEHLTC